MNIDVFSPTYYSKTKAQTCNNQRLGSAGKIDAMFLLQRCALRAFSMLKGQGARDQIALYASHSFLVEVEVYTGYIHSAQVCIIATRKLGLRALLIAHDGHNNNSSEFSKALL